MSDAQASLQGLDSYNRMIDDLMLIGGPGTSWEGVLRDEGSHLLETCVRYTPTARAEVIDQRTLYKERKLYSAYAGGDTGKAARSQPTFVSAGQRNNKAWYVAPNTTGSAAGTHRRHRAGAGQAWHQMDRADRRWPDWLWAAYQHEEADRKADYEAHLAKEMKAGRGARGLSARSWLDIADALGLSLRIAQYVRRAVPSNGRTYVNGAGRVDRREDGTIFTLENFQPILVQGDGPAILSRAVATRQAEFDHALEKRLFDDVEWLRKRYPSLLE